MHVFGLRRLKGLVVNAAPAVVGSDERLGDIGSPHRWQHVQHIALLTNDIVNSLKATHEAHIGMLEVDPSYYLEAFKRVPQVTEDKDTIKKLMGDDAAVFTHLVSSDIEFGGEVSTITERETIVFQRRGQVWLAVHEHLSPETTA